VFEEVQKAFQGGDYARAHELASKVPATDKLYPNARLLAALSTLRLGDIEAVLGEAERLTADFPKMAQAHNLLASVLFDCGRHDEAENACRRAAELSPGEPEVMQNLAVILDHNGWQAEAQHTLMLLTRRGGKLNRKAMLVLLRNTILLGDTRMARDIIAQARTGNPDDVELLNLAARVEFTEGRVDEGAELLKQALKVDPKSPDVLTDLGYLEMSAGDNAASSRYLREALKIDPSHSTAHFFFTHMGDGAKSSSKNDDREKRLANIREGLGNPSIPYLKKVDLGFAAGKILESLKNYDEAFEAYDRANKMVWDRLPPGAASFEPVFERVKSVFTKEFMAKLSPDDRTRGERMIFIVGMPRSGTTLLEQTLSGCSNVDGGGENGDIERLAQYIGGKNSNGHEFPEAVQGLSSAEVDAVAGEFLTQFDKGVPEGRVRTNKDMRLFMHMGLIATLFPGAKIIHSRRNPLDTCLSAYFQFFKMYRLQFTYNLGVLGGYYRAYVDIMDHWRKALPVEILDVDYENMVVDHEGEARRMIDFCGLEWNDDCLNFQQSKKMVKTASIWQVRQGIYQSSTERWRRYEKHLNPLIESLGDLVPESGEAP